MDPVDHLNGSLLLLSQLLDNRDNGTDVNDSTLSSANAGDLPVVSGKAPRVPTQSSSFTRTRTRLSHLLIATSDARDELLQGRRCVTE